MSREVHHLAPKQEVEIILRVSITPKDEIPHISNQVSRRWNTAVALQGTFSSLVYLAFFPCAIAFVIFTLVGDVSDSGPWPSLLYYSAAWTGVKSGLV